MQPSVTGLIVCLAILLVARKMGDALLIGALASLAFGATAIATLPSLGGASPLIYTAFTGALIATIVLRRHMWRDLGQVFGSSRAYWILVVLMAYALFGSWMLPRLYTGQASVFVQAATRGGVVESTLAPVSGNTTQTGYFIIGGLASIALATLLLHGGRMRSIGRGFIALCVLQAGMGLVDVVGKLGGLGDVLAPIRTANYAMLTDVTEAGFVRIAGGYSEASGYAAASLSTLAFAFTYWRRTGSRPVLALWLIQLVLLLVSTSSTAYAGLAILGSVAAVTTANSIIRHGMHPQDLFLLILFAISAIVVLGVVVVDPSVLDPVLRLYDSTIASKTGSASAQERAYWNRVSIRSLVQTDGLGVGLGSSRASSWIIAVLSQLGVAGALLVGLLVAVVVRGVGSAYERFLDAETSTVVAAARSAALASLAAASISAGTADPGVLFFFALAVVVTARASATAGAGGRAAATNGRAFRVATPGRAAMTLRAS
jgi:hypothetical protein